MNKKSGLNLYILQRNGERGAAFLEFAISFPFYMLLVLGIVELLYYNYQCINAQHIVSLAAEHLAKGELTDDSGHTQRNVGGNVIQMQLSPNECIDPRRTDNDAAASRSFDLFLAKQHIIYLASTYRSDFGTAQKTNEGQSTLADIQANKRSGRFSQGQLPNSINGNVAASNYGNVSICAIGAIDAAGNPIQCGWNEDPTNHEERVGRTPLHGQMIPQTGYPVSITLRYPHRPLALWMLSPMIGYFSIQAEAVVRMEPTSRPSFDAVNNNCIPAAPMSGL